MCVLYCLSICFNIFYVVLVSFPLFELGVFGGSFYGLNLECLFGRGAGLAAAIASRPVRSYKTMRWSRLVMQLPARNLELRGCR